MNEPKYISQRTILQKQIRLERRIRLEQNPSMDVVFVAASSTAEDIHSYSEGLRRSPDEYEITPQSQHIENNILIKKKPEPQPAPIQDMPINSPIRRIRRSYDIMNQDSYVVLAHDAGETFRDRFRFSGNLSILPELKCAEKKETEIVDVKQESSEEKDIEVMVETSLPTETPPDGCGIRSGAEDIHAYSEGRRRSPEEYESNRDVVIRDHHHHHHKWKRKMMYIGCATVVSGFITIIVILSLIFASMYAPTVPTTSSSSPNPILLPNTTTIRNHTITISGFYTTERSDTNYFLIKFKGDGCIQFTETVIGKVLLVGGGGGVSWGDGFLSDGSGTGGLSLIHI